MNEIRERYLRLWGGNEDLAALAFARDLMRGDPAEFKAGYSAANAAIATFEVFPAAMVDVERALSVGGTEEA